MRRSLTTIADETRRYAEELAALIGQLDQLYDSNQPDAAQKIRDAHKRIEFLEFAKDQNISTIDTYLVHTRRSRS